MTPLQALVYGIIQGLTEFLPISSTAHLRVIPALLGWEDPGAAFTAVIQWGTLLAVLIYFRADVVRLLLGWLRGLQSGRPLELPDSRLAWMILVGTIPIVAVGLLLKKHIETSFRSLYVVAGATLFFAALLFLADLAYRRRGDRLKGLADLGWIDAISVGFAQALALIPGASRSGVTITGGLFLGQSRETAARFSFLLSLPSIFAAGVYELYKERHELLASQDAIVNLAIATVVSGILGYATIAFLLGYLRTHSTGIFVAYRLVLGLVILGLLFAGKLSP